MKKLPKPKLPQSRIGSPGRTASPGAQEESLTQPLEREASGVEDLRLLVIDDDPARIDTLAVTLRDLGIEVAVGGRVESGYQQAVRLMPDAVISDLTSPGEQGWWLVQRLRRHPLLRWTPVLLLRWWEESTQGEGQVLIDRVLDRLEEVLAPLHVLRERIKAKQPLSERIQTIGPPALLRVLIGENIRGLLTVNDAWSVFEVGLSSGKICSVVRRGVDGVVEEGDEAFLELLLCDAGRWSFRYQKEIESQPKLESNLTRALERSGRILNALFGSETTLNEQYAGRLKVQMDVLTAVAPTLSATGQRISESIRAATGEAELGSLIKDINDSLEIERALQALVRCGAIRLQKEALKEKQVKRDAAELKATKNTIYLFEAIAADRGDSADTEGDDIFLGNGALAGKEGLMEEFQARGMYRVSEVEPERLTTMKNEILNMPGTSIDQNKAGYDMPKTQRKLEETTPMDPSGTPVMPPNSSAMNQIASPNRPPQPKSRKLLSNLKRLIHDSLVPSPHDHSKKGTKQMWLAIILALLLGGILVAGLVVIGSEGRGKPPVSSDR
ncbi:MAG: hypothetical protein GY847_40185 [Proteobacteria bacterium]|nr:hypothetical protein [Pseudomonadota bacterium]